MSTLLRSYSAEVQRYRIGHRKARPQSATQIKHLAIPTTEYASDSDSSYLTDSDVIDEEKHKRRYGRYTAAVSQATVVTCKSPTPVIPLSGYIRDWKVRARFVDTEERWTNVCKPRITIRPRSQLVLDVILNFRSLDVVRLHPWVQSHALEYRRKGHLP